MLLIRVSEGSLLKLLMASRGFGFPGRVDNTSPQLGFYNEISERTNPYSLELRPASTAAKGMS
jgi:hypothetical protein